MPYESLQHKRLSSKCSIKTYPQKLTLNGNFTHSVKSFDIETVKMRKDIIGLGMKGESPSIQEFHHQVFAENPTYEDPRDIVAIGEKPLKPPRKRQGQASSPRSVKDGRTLLKDQKKKLTKKYEGLIMTLMDRCEENVVLISEKDSQISKLKEKLKAVLDYNRLFADENDSLRAQNDSLLAHIQQCNEKIEGLEEKRRELEDRVKHEAPDRDTLSSAIPLVEVCISCSSRQILLGQVREQNSRLHADMQALKDVLYRLNIQLAKYQERLRSNTQNLLNENKENIHKPSSDAFDSLITASLIYKQDGEENPIKCGRETPSEKVAKLVDSSCLLSAQALAPLFDAYQDNIQEKENLIHDYEKQFENINRKSKDLVSENKSLKEKLTSLEEELSTLTKRERKLAVERETSEIEKTTLTDRAEKAEAKLKEVYELYEDKMAAMMRDYETVHREYFAAKNALASYEGKMARMDATLRDRTVPADLHERRVESCKRLLDELKHQYSMENERKTEQLKKLLEERSILEAQKRSLEEKQKEIEKENEALKEMLKTAEKNVKLYRKAAEVFRSRLKRSEVARRSLRRRRFARCASGPVNAAALRAMPDLARIRDEIKLVKSRAYKSLEELEEKIISQERRAARAEEEYRHELERARLALEHKEGVIRSLIDKVADVEEVRLSQSNTHRLQGIVLESSERSEEENQEERREDRRPRLVPTGGGYYQDGRRKKRDS